MEQNDKVPEQQSYREDSEISIFGDEYTLPVLYSPKVIRIFSILFSTFTGSILMAINLKEKEVKNMPLICIGFGIAYTAIIVWVTSLFPKSGGNFGTTIPLNILGSYLLNRYFWNTYIGENTQYSPKPFWIPLVICLAFCALFLLPAFLNR